MAGDNPPADKGKGKEPVKDTERAHGVNGTKEPHEKTTPDGKKPADIDLPVGAYPSSDLFHCCITYRMLTGVL